MLTPKLLTFLVGFTLLLPFAITFWIMAFRDQDTEAELKMRHDQAMAELKAEYDSNHGADEADPDPVMVGVVAYECMGLPMVPPDMWSFFPRRWVGIVGLFCVFIMSSLWLLSSFVPAHTYSGSTESIPPPEPITAPTSTPE